MCGSDSATAMTDVKDLVPDVLNAFVNGWVPPAGAEGDLFPGLIGSGSFLDELFTTTYGRVVLLKVLARWWFSADSAQYIDDGPSPR